MVSKPISTKPEDWQPKLSGWYDELLADIDSGNIKKPAKPSLNGSDSIVISRSGCTFGNTIRHTDNCSCDFDYDESAQDEVNW